MIKFNWLFKELYTDFRFWESLGNVTNFTDLYSTLLIQSCIMANNLKLNELPQLRYLVS